MKLLHFVYRGLTATSVFLFILLPFVLPVLAQGASCGSNGSGKEYGVIRKIESQIISGDIKGISPYNYSLASSSNPKAGDVFLYGGSFWRYSGAAWPPSISTWTKAEALKFQSEDSSISYYQEDNYGLTETICGEQTTIQTFDVNSSFKATYDPVTGVVNYGSCQGGGTSHYLSTYPTESDASEGVFTINSDCSHEGHKDHYHNDEYTHTTGWGICDWVGYNCFNYEGGYPHDVLKYQESSYITSGTYTENPPPLAGHTWPCGYSTSTYSHIQTGQTNKTLTNRKTGSQAMNEKASSLGDSGWTSSIMTSAYIGAWSESGSAFTFTGRAVRFKVWFACLSDKTKLDFKYRVWPMEGNELLNGKLETETRSAGSLDMKEAEDGGFEVKGMVEAKDGYYKRLISVSKQASCDGSSDDKFGTSNGGKTSSLHWWVSLGTGADGRAVGNLRIDETIMSANTATPVRLKVDSDYSTPIEVLRDGESIRQVKVSQGLIDVVTLDAYSYEIRFYDSIDVDPVGVSGFYEVSGTPVSVWTVENPSASTSDFDELKISHTLGEGNEEYLFRENTTGAWSLEQGGEQKEERTETTLPNGDHQVVLVIKNSASVASYKVREVSRDYPFGTRLIEQILDPDGSALTSTWTYYDNTTTDGAAYGQLKQTINADGSWERYEYDSAGRQSKVVSTWLNGSPTAAESASRVVTTSWSTDGLTATIIEKVEGNEIGRRYWVKNSAETEYQNIVCTVPGAAIGASTNLVTTTQYIASGEFKGQVAFVSHPDGTISTHSYSRNPSNGRLTTVEASGQASGTTVVAGKRTTTVEDIFGNLLSSEIKDIASGLVIESYEVTDADEFGRPLRIDYNDGSYEEKTYTCCGVEYERARDGTVTTYGYDGLKRLERETRGGISTLYTYDGSGRVLTRSRKGTDNSVIVQETNTYDLAGRQKTTKDALNYTTTFDYDVDGGGRTVRTTTYPDGGTRIETTNKDGQLASVLGTAVHPTKMEYGTVSTGLFRKEIKVGEGGAETEWTRTESDAAGRATKTVGANGGETVNSYNSLGQLAKVTDPDGVRTLYTYNGEGDREKTIIDKDQSNSQSADDFVTLEETSVLTAHGTTVQRREARILNVSNAWVVANRSDSTPNGLSQWTEEWGLPTTVTTTIGSGGSKTETTVRADGSQLVRTSTYDRVTSEVASAGSDVMSSTTFHHDAHGRMDSSTDARNGVTTYHYTDRDQVDSTTNPGSQTTGYAYDSMGRMEVQTLPDSSQVSNEYYPTGELKKTSGSQTYTAQYTYQPQGRVKTLTTTGAAGAEVTTWNYYPDSGSLSSKIYANGQGTSYTYKPSGRLETRVWARGITTTYSYNGAGDLTGIDYSDSTPDVTYGRNRLRQITNITDGAGTRTLSSSDDGRPTGETYDSGMFAGISSSTEYDSLKRRDSHTVNVGSSALVTGYGYDGGSRLETVTSGSDTAIYHYAPNSNLIDTITQKSGGVTKLVTSKAYDSLNRLTSISAVAGANVVSSHTYIYNSLNQRSLATLHDGTKWGYSYDALGQVTGGSRSWSDNTPVAGQQFGYNYDGIGNRTSTTVNGRTATYTSNTLNQYSSRTVPGAIDIMGEAASEATVTINSLLAQRKGAYFYRAVPFSNQTAAQYPEVKVMAVKNGAGSGGEDLVAEQTGRHYLAKTPEAFTYDADGNMLTDGRWQYTWDGENRLVGLRSLMSAPDQAKWQLTFKYDNQGRRISKKNFSWGGSAYVFASEGRYLYDGWNLTIELNDANLVQKDYSWGADLKGGIATAGGVGGLLISKQGGESYYPSYDGNGNVVSLMSASTLIAVARYQYGPLGELVAALENGLVNPFRFSTKYFDQESGHSYFGYRYFHSQLGRWLNRDPIEERGGKNLYAIVNNGTINSFDPLGLANSWSLFANWLFNFTGFAQELSWGDFDSTGGQKRILSTMWRLKNEKNLLKLAKGLKCGDWVEVPFSSIEKGGGFSLMPWISGYESAAVVDYRVKKASIFKDCNTCEIRFSVPLQFFAHDVSDFNPGDSFGDFFGHQIPDDWMIWVRDHTPLGYDYDIYGYTEDILEWTYDPNTKNP